MKQKYYLRGIGVGILFASIILFVAYLAGGREKMTDAQIIERAEELGMVTTESALSNLNKTTAASTTDTSSNTNASSEEVSSEKPSETTTEATTKATTEATTRATTEATTRATTEATTRATTEATTEATTRATTEATTRTTTEATTESSSSGTSKVKFTVVGGMDSYSVAKVLEDKGVIKDALDFDNYLEANGYSARIATGEYTVAKGADYETIAKLLTGN